MFINIGYSRAAMVSTTVERLIGTAGQRLQRHASLVQAFLVEYTLGQQLHAPGEICAEELSLTRDISGPTGVWLARVPLPI
jgi:hypothetical protein